MRMNWGNPLVLVSLWLTLPLAAFLLCGAERRHARLSRQFAGNVMVERLLPPRPRWRIWFKGTAWLLGILLLTIAAARPRFGVYYETVVARGADLMVLLDVSRSMLAEDVPPNRLQRARLDIKDLLRQVEGDRVGLIAFAGVAVVKVPLTTDQNFFRAALDEVDPREMPRGGSFIGLALEKALAVMPPRADRDQAIILITDGEDQGSDSLKVAQTAAARNVKIITVGLGDPKEGARVPTPSTEGEAGFVKYQGQEVWSKLDEELLRGLANATGGAYVPARTGVYDLGEVYDQHLGGLRRGELQSSKRKRYREQFQVFLALGILAFLAEAMLPFSPRSTG